MRVLVDARMVGKSMHGISHYVVNLIKSLDREGHSVGILTVEKGTRARIESWTGIKIDSEFNFMLPFQNPLAPLELLFFLVRSKSSLRVFDIIHFTSFSVPLFLSFFKIKKRTIVTMHDIIHILPQTKPGQSQLSKPSMLMLCYFRFVVGPALNACAKVLTVSKWTAETTAKAFRISENKFTHIPNGLDTKWFVTSSTVNVHPNSPFFICVSNIKDHKNVYTLVQAAIDLWKNGKAFDLILVLGVQELPTSWDVESRFLNRIKLRSQLNETDLLKLYQSAVATVQPSQYEGYSFPVAETLAVGGEVIASKASAHVEFASENGIHFYEPFNSISELSRAMNAALANFPKALALKQQNGKRVHSENVISAEESGTRVIKVYEEVLRSNPDL